jgi:hypothetical protein
VGGRRKEGGIWNAAGRELAGWQGKLAGKRLGLMPGAGRIHPGSQPLADLYHTPCYLPLPPAGRATL